MNKVELFLRAKTAGLPRWVWLTLAGGAVGFGLYLRSKHASEEATGEEPAKGENVPGGVGAYEGTEGGAGLAAAGLVGPAAGQVVPVETPMLPEGLVDAFTSVTELAGQLGAYISEEHNVTHETEAITGGGPTSNTGVHLPSHKAEIQKLEGEIDTLQKLISKLTSEIKAEKSKKKPDKQRVHILETERAKAQGSIQYKRSKIAALKALQTVG